MLPLPLRKVKHKAKANHHGTRILRMTTIFCCHSVFLGLSSLCVADVSKFLRLQKARSSSYSCYMLDMCVN